MSSRLSSANNSINCRSNSSGIISSSMNKYCSVSSLHCSRSNSPLNRATPRLSAKYVNTSCLVGMENKIKNETNKEDLKKKEEQNLDNSYEIDFEDIEDTNNSDNVINYSILYFLFYFLFNSNFFFFFLRILILPWLILYPKF